MLPRFRLALIPAICFVVLAIPSLTGEAKISHPEKLDKCFRNYKEAALKYNLQEDSDFKTAAAFARRFKNEKHISRSVTAIYEVSKKTGVDFDLLLLKAILESNIGENIVASNSSARGLFQFVENTWLVLMKRYGADLGYPGYAGSIEINKKTGLAKTASQQKRKEILSLRNDPYISTYLKARQIREETSVIKCLKGASVTKTDHYIAHLLGLKLAGKFYSMISSGSPLPVANLGDSQLREAARLNRQFFFNGNTPLTARQAYRRIEQRVKREIKNIASISARKDENFCVPGDLLSLAALK
jgi:hypothetical protein